MSFGFKIRFKETPESFTKRSQVSGVYGYMKDVEQRFPIIPRVGDKVKIVHIWLVTDVLIMPFNPENEYQAFVKIEFSEPGNYSV